MDVRIPEPVGSPVELFGLYFKEQKFSNIGFNQLVDKCLINLENVCGKLNTGLYSVIDYDLTFYSDNKEIIGGLLKGGGVVNDEFRELWFGHFQRDYRMSFEKAKREYSGNPINADMHLVAWRDNLTRVVDAKDPY
jgi:hypothetical protein